MCSVVTHQLPSLATGEPSLKITDICTTLLQGCDSERSRLSPALTALRVLAKGHRSIRRYLRSIVSDVCVTVCGLVLAALVLCADSAHIEGDHTATR